MPNRSPHHPLRVLTIGAAITDTFVKSEHFEQRKDALAPDGYDACFRMGSKIAIDDMVIETGGGATNAAVTFRRFGLQTACAARIGNDLSGQLILERLVNEGIHTSHIQRDAKQKTGQSIILLSQTGHRSIMTFRGAAASLEARKINWRVNTPDWIYLTSVAGNYSLLKDIFAQAKKRGIGIAWNPGNAELAFGLSKLSPWLLHVDILILNREEAGELADQPPRHLDAIIHRLGTFPRHALVITDGGRGAYVHARGTLWFAPALKAKRVNTTGAGDAFGSAFVAGALLSGNLEIGLRAGMLNATGVVTHMGAKAGILKQFPSHKELASVRVKNF